mmetsp:Transcript_4182/g.5491  ORF Transcript_4182/g.5491 Transcript_4182/m.5491 type:complete len:200 (+) Transcript_4182:74-673(+)
MATLQIDLVEHLTGQARNLKQKETSPLRAHALVQWLLLHHFPSKIRKSPQPIDITTPHRGKICLSIQFASLQKSTEAEVYNESDVGLLQLQLQLEQMKKNVFHSLKKIHVEDLGNMNATELQSSIPPHDSEGRGMQDLQDLEKKLSVKVVFDSVTGHVLLVGDEKKLEKKVFVLRNMLSHYHWRLSGTDVVFDNATSAK